MRETARSIAAHTVLVLCVVALMATSPRSNSLSASHDFDLLLSTTAPSVTFDVELELPRAVLDAPFRRPLTVSVRAARTLVPDGAPEDGSMPSVRTSVEPLGDDSAPKAGRGASEVEVELPRSCFRDESCTRRFRVQVTRSGGAGPDVIAHVRLQAYADYDERPDGADVELRHTFPPEQEADGPLTAERERQLIVAQDGSIVTFTRTSGGDDARVRVELPNDRPDDPDEGEVLLSPLAEGPDLALPLGFTTVIDPFVGCAPRPPCIREYAMVVPPLGTRPRLHVTTGANALVEAGRSSLPDLDVVVAGTERGSVRVTDQSRIERRLRVTVAEPTDPDEFRGSPYVEVVGIELRVEAEGLDRGAVEAVLIAPSRGSNDDGRRVLTAERPAAGAAWLVSNELQALDVLQDLKVTVVLRRGEGLLRRGEGGEPVEVAWELRAVFAGDTNLTEAATVEFVPGHE